MPNGVRARPARRRPLALLVAALAAGCATAHPSPGAGRVASPRLRIAYAIAMPDTIGHLYEVRIDIGGSLGDTLRLQMPDRKSTRLNSSHPSISYAVFCLKKKTQTWKKRVPVLNSPRVLLTRAP